MSMYFRTVAFGAILFLSAPSYGQDIEVNDSLKDTEIRIAQILKDKLKINGSLQIRGDNAEDLMLRVSFNADKEQNMPAIAAIVDVRILNRDKEGKAVAQVVSIASFANIVTKPDSKLALLEWANTWNSKTIPMRVYISGNRIIAGRNLLVTRNAPVSESQIVTAFTGVVRAWTTLLKDIRKASLIDG